ncbi:alpha-mannosidase [Sphingobacteriaceae bacterium]|nr:alpha-mannosidase [Sphingobacteriaceae bacterium]
MTKKLILKRLFLLVFITSCGIVISQTNYNQYVNPFIGTGGHGHTFPGAVLPFGMVQLSPDTRVDDSWDGCSGYHYSDESIYGFSHTHLSGTGCSDYGDILLMPMVGEPSMDNRVYASKFSHANEKAGPGFYEVLLDDDKIKAELTVTPRLGIHRYTFPKTEQANIIIDLLHRDQTLNCGIRIMDSVTVTGYRVSKAWAQNQHVYFVMKFSKPFTKAQIATGRVFKEFLGKKDGRPEGAFFRFDNSDGKPLTVKVAISSTGIEGAIKNMAAEGTHWDFEKYKKAAEDTWSKQLSKIEITEPDKEKMTVFYSALYHTCIHPSLNMDVDNRYRGRDDKLHTANGFTNYTVFSLWDTYRALNPLMTIIEPKRASDFINTFLVQYQQSGRLPMWELSANETDCMIGFHSVSVIADAMTKGIGGFDKELAFQAIKAAANYSAYGIPIFNNNKFLQIDDESESVSKSLEYAYDNWCIAKVGKLLLKKEDLGEYLKRAQSYKNLFDAQSGCMRPRKNGNWLTPFYPSEINNHFTEGNSWHYSFAVPQDIEGLIKLHGSKENFSKKLDELFTTSQKTRGRDQADVTGLIGQYAHGNEPSHHMAYLYNYVGSPQKTIERVHQICNDFYLNSPDGLIGNEDCGQMSAWYIFSSMGFYPVCPGNPVYTVAEPIFKSVKINLDNGKKFIITSDALQNKPVKGLALNGKTQMSASLDHAALIAGGTLNFIYTPSANSKDVYGSKPISSSIGGAEIIPSPVIISTSQVFKDKLDVSIANVNINIATTYYTKDGSEPTKKSTPYTSSFLVDKNTTVKARTFAGQDTSAIITASFYKIKYNYDITIKSKANPQYASEGSQTLIDGIIADKDWRKGNWLGYQSQDFECLVDLKEDKEISYLSLNCLQDSRSWILFPASVDFYVSDDNMSFKLLDSVTCGIKPEEQAVKIFTFQKELAQKVSARYLKIVAKNYGKLPEWHVGKGGDAFIFVDELEIR